MSNRTTPHANDALLLPCPLCGAGNEHENNVRFSPTVSGHVASTGSTSPQHTFAHCQMVQCNVCGLILIDPFDVVKKWNENRLRHQSKRHGGATWFYEI